MIPAHKNGKNPPGQIVNKETTPGFDRYPWLKTSSAPDPKEVWPFPPYKGISKAPISPAKRLGDIIDRVVASSSEPASKGSYEQGYKDGWNAAIVEVCKKELDNF